MSGSMRQVPQQSAAQQKGGRVANPSPLLPILLSIVGVLIVIAVIGFVWVRGSSSRAVQPTSQAIAAFTSPTATYVAVTPTPSCLSIAPFVEQIVAQEQAGQWDDASRAAEGALAVSNLCSSDRKALTQYAVSDGLKAIYMQPFEPRNITAQQHMVDSYLVLKQRAQDADVVIDTPLQVATNAFSSSQFYLARIALEEAFKDGSFKPDIDRDITKRYVSSLYGLGKWYTTAPKDTPLYQEGLAWLVASDQIAVKYETGQGEAAMLLSQLISSDKSTWPHNAETPLLANEKGD